MGFKNIKKNTFAKVAKGGKTQKHTFNRVLTRRHAEKHGKTEKNHTISKVMFMILDKRKNLSFSLEMLQNMLSMFLNILNII